MKPKPKAIIPALVAAAFEGRRGHSNQRHVNYIQMTRGELATHLLRAWWAALDRAVLIARRHADDDDRDGTARSVSLAIAEEISEVDSNASVCANCGAQYEPKSGPGIRVCCGDACEREFWTAIGAGWDDTLARIERANEAAPEDPQRGRWRY